MSEYERDLGTGTISGRVLPAFKGPEGVLGTVRVLPEATEYALALARRNLREIQDADLERLGERRFRDTDGQVWCIPHGAPDLYDTTAAEAFVVRDQLIVPLQRADKEPGSATAPIGEMRARKA